jgi:hypothetical protein
MRISRRVLPRRTLSALSALLLASSALVAVGVGSAQAANPSGPAATHPDPSADVPTVSAPLTGGAGASSVLLADYPLSSVGYATSEYAFSGTAHSYVNTAPLDADGNWSAEPAAGTAAYTSRLVVVRPQDPARFSGTVVVEWMNVSSGMDGAPNWSYSHDDLIRNGDVYVGVSAQKVGVDQAKTVDATRYTALTHPGDSYSYDIFSQAGQAVREVPAVLQGLQPSIVVAEGESQSAFRLTTYVNAIAPLVNVFDSYLINSRSASAAPLSQAPQADVPAPAVVRQRDLGLPVLTFQTETDVAGPLDYLPARQADSANFRLWEAAGTSHADTYLLAQSFNDNGSWGSDLQQFASLTGPPSSVSVSGFSLTCPVPFNAGPQHYVFQAAQRGLIDWTYTGAAPRSMPRLSVDTTTVPATYRLDANGNVLGGVRSPQVDAPIATLSGLPPAGAPGFCTLFGQTDPFTPSELSALYPTPNAFAQAWRAAVDRSLAAGSLLPADAARLRDVVTYLNSTETLVTRIYQDLLGRFPDDAGLRGWTNLLLGGTPVSVVANAITASPEYRGGLIRDAYAYYLDREPSAADTAFWLGQFNKGVTPQRLEAAFAGSPEFYALAGGTDEDWVLTLYAAVLGRDASDAEVDARLADLAGGITRAQLATGFLLSPEHLGDVVDGYYGLLLHRSVDPTGRALSIAFLRGPGRIEQIIAAVVASPEYTGDYLAG